ncbi:hypothetical protein GOV10_02830 [Candidatus Woesearchaeota archaeon]|nr:hypothetical protein [Candidatus Woesearchaeota archaeon]
MRALEAYKTFLAQFSEEENEDLLANIVVQGRRLFHDVQNNQAYCEEHNIQAHSLGLYLGEAKRFFEPTPYCVSRLADFSKLDQRATLDKKGAWMFLCGKDIFGNAVLDGTPEKETPVFLYTEEGENLGYGQWVVNALTPRTGSQVVILNRADRGAYLRREKR